MGIARALCCTVLGFLLTPTPAVVSADEDPPVYDRVTLSVSAESNVENDVLVAVLFSQRDGPEVAGPAGEVNEAIAWAVEQAKGVPEVKLQTLDYRTHPVYRKDVLSGWRVSQSIRLESHEAALISVLIGELQQRLGLRSVGYAVSPQRRREAEDQLIAEAIGSFRARADLVARELGRTRYRIVRVDVNTGGRPIPRMPTQRMAIASGALDAPPTLEAGTQTVQVSVSGSIELQVE